MLRLVQGDVGSGKTVVALLAMLHVVATGAQAALLVPTEILARQHHATLTNMLKPLGITPGLLHSKMKAAEKRDVLAGLADGSMPIVVGTHALLSDNVTFADLGLAVVDEQHRFGVRQRLILGDKGVGVDVLVMTATPIPRTLAMTAYGDLVASRIDEKPPGRKPVTTTAMPIERSDEIVERLRQAIGAGKQAYWICPLVDESDNLDIAAAEERHAMLRAALPEANVALVHGRMDGETRDTAMENFRSGESSLLVATTVVEVGVDVPNASIMIIEHAERFGLAQMHQLRGRVGRGDDTASCLLLYKALCPILHGHGCRSCGRAMTASVSPRKTCACVAPVKCWAGGSQETLTSSLLIWPITVICLPSPMMRSVIFSAAIRALRATKVSG